jgi:hypothetical protein
LHLVAVTNIDTIVVIAFYDKRIVYIVPWLSRRLKPKLEL